jgi:Protein of unknown function (DUF1449)
MNALLEWWNFVFALPLAAGLILSAVMAFSGFGSGDGDGHAEAHGDLEAHADHVGTDQSGAGHDHNASSEAESRGFDLPGLFGLGRGAPLSVMLPMLLAAWGLGGLVLNAVLAPILRFPAVFAPISVVAGVFVAMIAGRILGGLFGRFLEPNRRTAVRRGGLVGCSGRAAYSITTAGGAANVKDAFGNIHRLEVRARSGEITPDTEILVLDFLEPDGVYIVEPHPFPEKRSARA